MAFFTQETVQYADLGSHKLAFLLDGTESRKDNQPIFIVFPGVTSSINQWAAVYRLLDHSVPILWYERAGYSFSSPSPSPPSSTIIAKELNTLLEVTKITGPYILVGHSWGGTLSREFLHLRPHDIAGMVLIDTVTSYVVPDPAINAVTKGVDYLTVCGIVDTHKLTPEEWKAFMDEEEDPKHGAQAEKEIAQLIPARLALDSKEQLTKQPTILGDNPVVVIRAHGKEEFEKMYIVGVEMGNGTEEERRQYRQHMAEWEEKEEAASQALFGLSKKGKYVRATCGHNVQLQQPELLVDEIKWMYDSTTGHSH